MNDVCGFDIFPVKSRAEEYLVELNKIKEQIADLSRIKDALGRLLLKELNLADVDDDGKIVSVKHDGQQTLEVGNFKVTVKTPSTWKINKREYEVEASRLRKEFNPVKTSISYRIDKKILETASLYGSKEDNDLILSFASFDYTTFSIIPVING